MQIDLPDDPKFQALATAAGFATVGEYVRALLAHDAVSHPGEQTPLSREAWTHEFQDFLRTVRSTNPDFDDSRDSIYPVR